ncbi:hypothetical protein MGG_18111 [Pyricularia oryzae 70-15]|uniref:Uncharacterized protein n=3 Tax=Pyricularia oryzae TaxID=318829 RepID=Q2KEW1_PYRO7|nr:uncharacterized protein MGG_18111 [Pyricularia oryzae 70-15]ELQ41294.1 hypothetical protein OOU_Y34scaffold00285g1 [Pyricularia oryzae Y34]KAI7913809.1 hypothetical protein M9X92_009268 [Pyricularia oryzae]EAQ71518.1 hypothetical protein MGCH7_ch7g925 [Pyricularia oryzae 70-15]KAI7914302.1 hypothetical protein M0657_009548 [Pyricularia oryzae]KYQ30474.1 hypothetical protein MGG_18111 [Pyricularia oryzae 70-15]
MSFGSASESGRNATSFVRAASRWNRHRQKETGKDSVELRCKRGLTRKNIRSSNDLPAPAVYQVVVPAFANKICLAKSYQDDIWDE